MEIESSNSFYTIDVASDNKTLLQASNQSMGNYLGQLTCSVIDNNYL